MALRQDPISDDDEEEEEKEPSASEKKVCMEKLLGWVKSMETESPDAPYPPQTGESNNSGAPSAKVQKLINFNESLTYTHEANFTNHDKLLAAKSIFYDMISQIEPDKYEELLAGQVELYKRLVTKNESLSVGTTKGEPGRKK